VPDIPHQIPDYNINFTERGNSAAPKTQNRASQSGTHKDPMVALQPQTPHATQQLTAATDRYNHRLGREYGILYMLMHVITDPCGASIYPNHLHT